MYTDTDIERSVQASMFIVVVLLLIIIFVVIIGFLVGWLVVFLRENSAQHALLFQLFTT